MTTVQVMLRTVAGGAVVLLTAAAPLGAQTPTPAATNQAATAEALRQRIDDIEAQVERLNTQRETLEEQAREAERLARRQGELDELHDDSRERIADARKDLLEMDGEDAPEHEAERARLAGRRAFLNARIALDEAILRVADQRQLEAAEQTRERIDDLEREWDLVQDPALDFAVDMEELAERQREEPSAARADILETLARLGREDAAARRQLLELERGCKARERQADELRRRFDGEL